MSKGTAAEPEVMPPAVASQEHAGTALKVPAGLDPAMARLMEIALEKGTVESLERLVALSERVEGRRAAQEFAAAKADFQSACPPVKKSSTAKITTKAGGSYSYAYAELDEIARTVGPHLHARGLSYSWDSEFDGKNLAVVCTLRHLNGHSESARFKCPVDTAAAMSDAQKCAAALTFARRQSLVQVLGLTTTEEDDDGRSAGSVKGSGTVAAASSDFISESQAADLAALVEEVGADLPKFLGWLGVTSIEMIPASRYQNAVKALEGKRKAGSR